MTPDQLGSLIERFRYYNNSGDMGDIGFMGDEILAALEAYARLLDEARP